MSRSRILTFAARLSAMMVFTTFLPLLTATDGLSSTDHDECIIDYIYDWDDGLPIMTLVSTPTLTLPVTTKFSHGNEMPSAPETYQRQCLARAPPSL